RGVELVVVGGVQHGLPVTLRAASQGPDQPTRAVEPGESAADDNHPPGRLRVGTAGSCTLRSRTAVHAHRTVVLAHRAVVLAHRAVVLAHRAVVSRLAAAVVRHDRPPPRSVHSFGHSRPGPAETCTGGRLGPGHSYSLP